MKEKILVWLSWWVDSAVSAYLLQNDWYEVTWAFMKNYVSEGWNCTTREDAESAINVAKFLWIELKVFDFQKEYEEKILNYIFEWYKKWITPNPDILCNNLIKFDLFLQKAIELWFDKIATWHYAKIKEENEKSWNKKIITTRLLRWKDYNKDQTYFLSWLNQFQLSKSFFPIGELQKDDVRKIATEIWLPNANRPDSQWLCFVGNIPIKEFLMKKLPIQRWKIIDENWKVLWEHDWAWFFTIWQNRWLKLNHKAYVYQIDVKSNIVFVSKNKNSDNLTAREIVLADWNWIWENYKTPIDITAKIRYRQEPKNWKLIIQKNIPKVIFEEEQRAIAPGQSLVAYLWDECIWSGKIIKAES